MATTGVKKPNYLNVIDAHVDDNSPGLQPTPLHHVGHTSSSNDDVSVPGDFWKIRSMRMNHCNSCILSLHPTCKLVSNGPINTRIIGSVPFKKNLPTLQILG
jgi:hypothetical protein